MAFSNTNVVQVAACLSALVGNGVVLTRKHQARIDGLTESDFIFAAKTDALRNA